MTFLSPCTTVTLPWCGNVLIDRNTAGPHVATVILINQYCFPFAPLGLLVRCHASMSR